MNKQEYDVLYLLLEKPYTTQRELAEQAGCSLGRVNRCLKVLRENGYLSQDNQPTQAARELWSYCVPRHAVILAAGFGMRMVPINMELPKGLIEVHGQPLIERLICQLQEAGVQKIDVVVGYMKEQFEYLMDRYDVELVVNPEYSRKNNLHSLSLIRDLTNTYIVPGDLWCAENPFREHELYSWYMLREREDASSRLRSNRAQELTVTRPKENGQAMIGICYLGSSEGKQVQAQVREMCQDVACDQCFWDEALYQKDCGAIHAKVVPEEAVVEIDTYEQLRQLDPDSAQLKSKAIYLAAEALHCEPVEITNITALKKGMTNRSFLFSCRGKRYIMRIPGEGTEHLINRRQEAQVYQTIADKNICDNVIYIDPEKGYKITEYLEGTRSCDAENPDDVQKCMKRLRDFHKQALRVDHTFDLFRQINFYESLWEGKPSVYKDYAKTKERVFSLRSYIDAHAEPHVLTHIDAVPDNFLMRKGPDGTEEIRLIDWEYAGMQDPHVDIAMFSIYALYDREQIEALIQAYFTEGCPDTTRVKIYCYIAVCGLLWSNWCEYKRNLGVEFGAYSLKQYRYAKDYYRLAVNEMKKWEK